LAASRRSCGSVPIGRLFFAHLEVRRSGGDPGDAL
jgi:hypothetical protein